MLNRKLREASASNQDLSLAVSLSECNRRMKEAITAGGATIGAVSAFPPAAAVVIPITVVTVLAVWMYNMYERT